MISNNASTTDIAENVEGKEAQMEEDEAEYGTSHFCTGDCF
jgi:hypothetical protein